VDLCVCVAVERLRRWTTSNDEIRSLIAAICDYYDNDNDDDDDNDAGGRHDGQLLTCGASELDVTATTNDCEADKLTNNNSHNVIVRSPHTGLSVCLSVCRIILTVTLAEMTIH